jgi:hypothetical protein
MGVKKPYSLEWWESDSANFVMTEIQEIRQKLVRNTAFE